MHRPLFIRTFFTLSALALLGACATPPVTRQVPVDSSFVTYTINWSTTGTARPGGRQVVRGTLINVDGIMEICGAWAHEGVSGRENARNALRDRVVVVNGRPAMRNLSYFSRARSVEALDGTPANCKSTGQPYPTGGLDVTVERVGDGNYRVH